MEDYPSLVSPSTSGLFQDDLNLEARAVINDLTRAALSRGGGSEVSSRWRSDFAGGAEAAAAAVERAVPPLENASARRRRLAPPPQQQQQQQQRPGANTARGAGNMRAAPARPAPKLPTPADPIASMAKRQEQLKAAREERKERELL